VACLAAPPGTSTVVRYESEPVAVLLAGAPEAGAAFAAAVLGSVLLLPGADRDLLLTTLRSWFANDASAAAAAAQLYVHRNTVRYRLRRVEELTGLRLADPTAVGRLYVALEACRIFGLDRS
jgi:DNA-binding PucR family transcriptional regulator